jgi:hypothetical protein
LGWLVKNLVRSCGNDGELGCSGGEAALCRHVVRRIALATVSIWSCNPIDRLFLLLLWFFSRTELFGAMCWEATFKNKFIYICSRCSRASECLYVEINEFFRAHKKQCVDPARLRIVRCVGDSVCWVHCGLDCFVIISSI